MQRLYSKQCDALPPMGDAQKSHTTLTRGPVINESSSGSTAWSLSVTHGSTHSWQWVWEKGSACTKEPDRNVTCSVVPNDEETPAENAHVSAEPCLAQKCLRQLQTPSSCSQLRCSEMCTGIAPKRRRLVLKSPDPVRRCLRPAASNSCGGASKPADDAVCSEVGTGSRYCRRLRSKSPDPSHCLRRTAPDTCGSASKPADNAVCSEVGTGSGYCRRLRSKSPDPRHRWQCDAPDTCGSTCKSADGAVCGEVGVGSRRCRRLRSKSPDMGNDCRSNLFHARQNTKPEAHDGDCRQQGGKPTSLALTLLSKAELQEMCRDYGISPNGTKQRLTQRVVDAHMTNSAGTAQATSVESIHRVSDASQHQHKQNSDVYPEIASMRISIRSSSDMCSRAIDLGRCSALRWQKLKPEPFRDEHQSVSPVRRCLFWSQRVASGEERFSN